MVFRPIEGHALVRRNSYEKRSAGGVIIPDTTKRWRQDGVVEAVGPGSLLQDGTRAPMPVKVGDIVAFSTAANTKVCEEADDELLIMDPYVDIYGVWESPPDS